MNEPDDAKGRELVPDAWRELDDTLADAPATAAVPPAAKAWLADQRVLHGLLRALHTQDAAAREGRVAAILARLDAEPAMAPRRHWSAVLAAALLLALAGVWAVLPAALPTAEAAVQRVVAELARDVVRRYRVVVQGALPRGTGLASHEFALVTRPGSRFRLTGSFTFGPLQLGEIELGCDGTEVWMLSSNPRLPRRVVPLAERERLLQGLGDALDLGYLDLHDLVRRLPADFELAVVGREHDAADRAVLRIVATRKPADAKAKLRSASLSCDEATGMVTRLEAEVELARGGTRRLVVEYVGEASAPVEFTRPWR